MNLISIQFGYQQILETSHIPPTGLQEPWVTRLGRPDIKLSDIGLEFNARSIGLCVCNLDRVFLALCGHSTGHSLGE